MKNIVKFVIIFLFITSCSKKDDLYILSAKTSQLKVQKDYRSYLGLEYYEFSKKFRLEGDIENSKYFASKGLNIINNKEIIPENPIKWEADKSQIKLMIMMQKRLDDLMQNPNLVQLIPIQLAHLNYLYDCWISRESKSIHISDELARCRVRFSKLISEIEYYQNDLKKDKTKPIKQVEPIFKHFKLYFDYNSHQFNQNALSQLLDFTKFIESLDSNYKILLVGNTDRSGSQIYNKLLSLKRVNAVKKQLIRNGITKDFISYRAFGEQYPDIVTDDGIKKQENRSVDIFILISDIYENFNDFDVLQIKNKIYRNNIINKKALTNIES